MNGLFKMMARSGLSLFVGLGAIWLVQAETYRAEPVENIQVNGYFQVSEDLPFIKVWGDGTNALHPEAEFPPLHQYSYGLLKWDLTQLKEFKSNLSEIEITSAKITVVLAASANAVGGHLLPMQAYLASGTNFDLDSVVTKKKKLSDLPQPSDIKIGESVGSIKDASEDMKITVPLDPQKVMAYLKMVPSESTPYVAIYLVSPIRCERSHHNYYQFYTKEVNNEDVSPKLEVEYR